MPDTDPLTELTRPATSLDSLIAKHSERTGLDPELVRRLVSQESRGHSNAVSPKGAGGTMQLMPATAASLGVKNRFDPDENIRGGTDYLKQQLDKFGDVNLALAAYNAGPGAVVKYGNKVPPYAETQNYVKKIGGGYQGTGYAQDPLTALTQSGTKSSPNNISPSDPLAELTQPTPRQQTPRAPGGIAGIVNREMARTRPKKSILSAATGGMGGGQQGIEVGGKVGQPSEGQQTKGFIRGMAEMAGSPTQLLPQGARNYVDETVAKGATGLMKQGAGLVRSIPRDPFGDKGPVDEAANRINAGATQLQSGTQAIDKEANRGFISQTAQDVAGGTIASAPAMVLTRLGVPAPVAFGLQSYLEAQGRDADLKDILKETGVGAATGALFEIPVPARLNILARIGAKMGIVGGGNRLIKTITGTPDTFADDATMALFGGAGELKPTVRPELAEAIPASQPREFAPTLRPSELAERARTRTPIAPLESPESVMQRRLAERRGADTQAIQDAQAQRDAIIENQPRHVDLQRRLDDGTFGKETKAETAARQSQVAATEAPTEQPTEQPKLPVPQQPQDVTTPPSAVSPSQPAEAASTPSPDKGAATATIPETKPSKLAQGVEAKAVEAGLTEGFKDLPEYGTIKLADQAERAVKLLNDDPELAKQIATGKAEPPQGLHPESVFIALENRALQAGDVQTIEDLARGPQSVENSIMGQRLRILGERNPASPVKAIADIEKARSAGVPKEKLAKVTNQIKSELSVEMKKAAPKADAWQKFLNEIVCK